MMFDTEYQRGVQGTTVEPPATRAARAETEDKGRVVTGNWKSEEPIRQDRVCVLRR